MPEIGEVARVVHYLRKHLLNRTLASCVATSDDIVYGKVGCSSDAFQTATTGRKVTNVGQQGKYFYMTFDKPPHAVLHLGMTGWMRFSTEDSRYYKQAKENAVEEEWPPKYMKFLWKVEREAGGENREEVEVAFVDPRRLARIRLVDCDATEIRSHSPLKENGPDPVVDKEKFTTDFLAALLRRKKVPVKALLLDQANISGVGNWVADEVLYQARLHPEQYSNTFDDEQIKRLHDSMVDVCTTAVTTLSDSSQFPETWLMKHRWNKGKKDSNVLPNGDKITHLTVGGRTSAIVPSVQKKTAAVAGDVGEDGESTKTSKKRKRKVEADDAEAEETDVKPRQRALRGKKALKPDVEGEEEEQEQEEAPASAQTSTKQKDRKSIVTKVERDGKDAAVNAEDSTNKPKRATKPTIPGERGSARKSAGDAEDTDAKGKTQATSPKPRGADNAAIPGKRRSTRTR